MMTLTKNVSDARADYASIVAALRRLVEPGQVTELRALGARTKNSRPHTESGYFDSDHLGEMARCAARLSGHAKGVYCTLNPLHHDLLARRANRMDWAQEGELAGDKNVLRRRWL